jgi:hypothetical protein
MEKVKVCKTLWVRASGFELNVPHKVVQTLTFYVWKRRFLRTSTDCCILSLWMYLIWIMSQQQKYISFIQVVDKRYILIVYLIITLISYFHEGFIYVYTYIYRYIYICICIYIYSRIHKYLFMNIDKMYMYIDICGYLWMHILYI